MHLLAKRSHRKKTFFKKYIYISCTQSVNKNKENPGDSDGKKSSCNVGDPGLIPGLGRSPGEGNGYSLQYSCLENPMDREA